jgi:hypothetical protein
MTWEKRRDEGKRREWWFNLTWNGEYSTSYDQGPFSVNNDDEHVHVREVLPGDVVVSREEWEKVRSSLEKIGRWWDVSDPQCIVPQREIPGDPESPRNDSMAAFSIILAIKCIEILRKVEG